MRPQRNDGFFGLLYDHPLDIREKLDREMQNGDCRFADGNRVPPYLYYHWLLKDQWGRMTDEDKAEEYQSLTTNST